MSTRRNFFHDDARDSTSTTSRRFFFHDVGHYVVVYLNGGFYLSIKLNSYINKQYLWWVMWGHPIFDIICHVISTKYCPNFLIKWHQCRHNCCHYKPYFMLICTKSSARVCQHSEAMQWVQGVCRLRRRQWKRQEAVRSWWKTGFPCLEKVCS